MANHSFDIESYNAALRSELNKMWIIGIALVIVLIAMVVYSVVVIKEDKKKKFPYIQLICVVVISVFLMIYFGSSIVHITKIFPRKHIYNMKVPQP